MLKASASGTVLLRLVHTNRRNALLHPCCPHVRRSNHSSSSRSIIHATPPSQQTQILRRAAPDVMTSLQNPENTPSYLYMGQNNNRSGNPPEIRNTEKEESPYEQPKVLNPHIPRLGGESLRKVDVDGVVESVESGHAGPEEKLESMLLLERTVQRSLLEGSYLKKPGHVNFDWENLSTKKLRDIMSNRNSDVMEEAWEAYQRLALLELEYVPDPTSGGGPPKFFNLRSLDHYAQHLIQHRKRTGRRSREGFLRLLSVLARLRRERGRNGYKPYLTTQEWSALIHNAGTGTKTIPLEAYYASVDVFNDMMRCHAEAIEQGDHDLAELTGPNIVTYTTLLNIAYLTRRQSAINHAKELLKSSTKDYNRITFLCSMRHRFRQEGLIGSRSVFLDLERHGMEVDIDAVNAYLYCAALGRQLSIVKSIYNALRENLFAIIDKEDVSCNSEHTPSEADADSKEESTITKISVGGIKFPSTLVPDETTYNFVAQTFAYHGDFNTALEVFTDMLTTERRPPDYGYFQPSYIVFRAMFLGFAKFGTGHRKMSPESQKATAKERSWTWENLEIVLAEFFNAEAPSYRLNERVAWWIMESVRKTTNDEQKLCEIWRKLNSRFRIGKIGRMEILDKKYGPIHQTKSWRSTRDEFF